VVQSSDRLKREMLTYDRAPIDRDTAELLVWDPVVYPAVVREYEYATIAREIRRFPAEVALDLGCGPGWMTHFLAPRLRQAIGIDISQSLLNAALTNSPQNEHFVFADACRLPFLSGSIDLIVSVGSLHHLPLKDGLVELKRVLSANGEIALFEPNNRNPLARIGRRLFPTETHTIHERPLNPAVLRQVLVSEGWEILYWETQFLIVFAVSRILHLVRTSKQVSKLLVSVLRKLEDKMSSSGLTSQHGWIITCVARPSRTSQPPSSGE